MRTIATDIEGLLVIEPDVFSDKRGFFTETFQAQRYAGAGIRCAFVQDNLSYSTRGTLRGLHFQIRRPQAKLVYVISGEIFDVAVDFRPGSPTFGKWAGIVLSGTNHRQLWIPEGFAHGFFVLSDTAYFAYKCSDFYTPDDESGVLWSDTDIGIRWPAGDPIISPRDLDLPRLNTLGPDQLPGKQAID
ncbi:MAG: dTDP-4-dehydrorhamnose 3,5-epimerase [Desulfobacterales bacterium]|nr:dTDP-4-dehydrorhamnose 3,5-epimerase [Desulfobacterales bacterium]